MKHFLIPASIISLMTCVMACGKKSDDDSAGSASIVLKIRNADSGSTGLLDTNQNTTDGAGNVSFTPDSYKLWINTVVLQNDSGTSDQFYTCDTSADECEVNFADPVSIAKLETKLSHLPITNGTYTKVWLSCSPTSGAYAKFKGHATVTGGTKYTVDPATNDGNPVTDDASKNSEIKISYTSGSCGITMPLARSLVVGGGTTTDDKTEGVANGATMTMTMFSNLRLVAYYGPNTSPGLGGCAVGPTAANSGGPGFCTNYPSVFPYFGETAPVVEYYKVANTKASVDALTATDVNVIVKIIKDGEGTPFWASFGNFYTESTPNYGGGDKGVSGYANSVTSFAVNADASLTIKSGSYGFSDFKRVDHTGDVMGEGISNGAGTGHGVTYHYHAYPYTP